MIWSLPDRLPTNLFRYVFAVSWRHQIALVALTVITFLLEIVPLEIQRRVVNNLVKERPFQLVMVLCAAYAGAVLIQGATKLSLNIYRGWVGENATRDLRRQVIGYSGTARAVAPGAEARGIGAAMIVAEVEPLRAAATRRHNAVHIGLHCASRPLDGSGSARALFAAAGIRAANAGGDKPPRRCPGLGVAATRNQYGGEAHRRGPATEHGREADRSCAAAQ